MSETFPGGEMKPEALAFSGNEAGAQAEAQTGSSPEQDLERLHPAIWIGSLLDYNNGVLHGDWTDAGREDSDIWADVQRILATSPTAKETGEPAEEWGIFDYEDFGDWKPGEYEDLGVVAAVARGIAVHGPAFAAWADLHDADPNVLASFEDCFLGDYESPAQWAEELFEESGGRAELERATASALGSLAGYVTFDAALFANAAWLSGDVYFCTRNDGRVWIFRTNP